ncbi:hypothetical protein ACTXT7_007952 [Hymenolepis weldensis]
MRCGATFLEKTIFKECYVTDRKINLVGLDWIDELNLIQLPDENETCQTPSLEPKNAENLVRGCRHNLHVPRSLILLFIFSRQNQSDVILLSPTISKSAISILNKLIVCQKRSLRTQVHSLILQFAKFCSDRSITQLRSLRVRTIRFRSGI